MLVEILMIQLANVSYCQKVRANCKIFLHNTQLFETSPKINVRNTVLRFPKSVNCDIRRIFPEVLIAVMLLHVATDSSSSNLYCQCALSGRDGFL